MAGIKGMKGGGGARPGSGRKPRPTAATTTSDPTEFLTAVMTGKIIPSAQQLDAAKALLRLKVSPAGGVKEQRTEAAAALSTGRFAALPPPPRLLSKD